jgi:hypothetical protein
LPHFAFAEEFLRLVRSLDEAALHPLAQAVRRTSSRSPREAAPRLGAASERRRASRTNALGVNVESSVKRTLSWQYVKYPLITHLSFDPIERHAAMLIEFARTAVRCLGAKPERSGNRLLATSKRALPMLLSICISRETRKKLGVRRPASTRYRWTMSIQLAGADRSSVRGFR